LVRLDHHGKIPLAENRFLQAGNGAENPKEKVQAVLYMTMDGLNLSNLGRSPSLKTGFFRQVMELKIQRKKSRQCFI
jgi:hypothetical protein